MIVVRVLVLQMERFRWHLNRVHREHESRIVSDGDGPLAALLPCLPDGTVDIYVVEEHNRAASRSSTVDDLDGRVAAERAARGAGPLDGRPHP